LIKSLDCLTKVERLFFLSFGWAWCAYHDRFESSDRFRLDRRSSVGLRSNCRAAESWADLKRRYGISEAEWDAMLRQQGGRCYLCEFPTRRLVVDHNHTTGVVRHLLCIACNLQAGWHEANAVRFARCYRKMVRLKAYETTWEVIGEAT
jgi:hypothetical protein